MTSVRVTKGKADNVKHKRIAVTLNSWRFSSASTKAFIEYRGIYVKKWYSYMKYVFVRILTGAMHRNSIM